MKQKQKLYSTKEAQMKQKKKLFTELREREKTEQQNFKEYLRQIKDNQSLMQEYKALHKKLSNSRELAKKFFGTEAIIDIDDTEPTFVPEDDNKFDLNISLFHRKGLLEVHNWLLALNLYNQEDKILKLYNKNRDKNWNKANKKMFNDMENKRNKRLILELNSLKKEMHKNNKFMYTGEPIDANKIDVDLDTKGYSLHKLNNLIYSANNQYKETLLQQYKLEHVHEELTKKMTKQKKNLNLNNLNSYINKHQKAIKYFNKIKKHIEINKQSMLDQTSLDDNLKPMHDILTSTRKYKNMVYYGMQDALATHRKNAKTILNSLNTAKLKVQLDSLSDDEVKTILARAEEGFQQMKKITRAKLKKEQELQVTKKELMHKELKEKLSKEEKSKTAKQRDLEEYLDFRQRHESLAQKYKILHQEFLKISPEFEIDTQAAFTAPNNNNKFRASDSLWAQNANLNMHISQLVENLDKSYNQNPDKNWSKAAKKIALQYKKEKIELSKKIEIHDWKSPKTKSELEHAHQLNEKMAQQKNNLNYYIKKYQQEIDRLKKINHSIEKDRKSLSENLFCLDEKLSTSINQDNTMLSYGMQSELTTYRKNAETILKSLNTAKSKVELDPLSNNEAKTIFTEAKKGLQQHISKLKLKKAQEPQVIKKQSMHEELHETISRKVHQKKLHNVHEELLRKFSQEESKIVEQQHESEQIKEQVVEQQHESEQIKEQNIEHARILQKIFASPEEIARFVNNIGKHILGLNYNIIDQSTINNIKIAADIANVLKSLHDASKSWKEYNTFLGNAVQKLIKDTLQIYYPESLKYTSVKCGLNTISLSVEKFLQSAGDIFFAAKQATFTMSKCVAKETFAKSYPILGENVISTIDLIQDIDQFLHPTTHLTKSLNNIEVALNTIEVTNSGISLYESLTNAYHNFGAVVTEATTFVNEGVKYAGEVASSLWHNQNSLETEI